MYIQIYMAVDEEKPGMAAVRAATVQLTNCSFSVVA
jgi:hypothetical protein